MTTPREKLFPYVLWTIVVIALIPRLLLGASQFIHYDGYWHLFIATQDRWPLFISEWRGDAHPLLFYLLLRYVALLGHSHLVYRSISIIPGVGSVFLIGQIAKKLCRHSIVPLLAAAAFGLSITIIDINCDVRGYSLALFLVLCAFLFFLDFLVDSSQRQISRSLLWFGIFSSLAIATEYYAIFFWLACIAIFIFYALRYRVFREDFAKWLTARWRVAMVSAGLVTCVTLCLYITHVRYQPATENNVAEFYFRPSSSVLRFLSSGLRADLNYLLPVELPSTTALIVLLIAALPVLLYLTFFKNESQGHILAATPGLMFFLLLLELMVLSLVRRYPFGGYARQQSIIFPFLLLTAFVGLDRLIEHIQASWIRSILLIAVGLLIAVSFSYNWRKFPKISEELFTQQYRAFRTDLPREQAVYVDQFSLIAYYIHSYSWKWQFQKHYPGPERVDSYQTTSPAGEQLLLLRNKDEWNFDLLSQKFYFVLADCLERAHLKTANVFFLKQIPKPTGSAPDADIQAIRDQADRFGLVANPVVYKNTEAYITFRLK